MCCECCVCVYISFIYTFVHLEYDVLQLPTMVFECVVPAQENLPCACVTYVRLCVGIGMCEMGAVIHVTGV